MRASLIAILVVGALLGGCFDQPAPSEGGVELTGISIPDGARLEPTAEGVRLVWADVAAPFEADVTVPQGTTLVRLTAEGDEQQVISTAMSNTETGRRRCQPTTVWQPTPAGTSTCSGVTAMDDLPAAWTVSARGGAALDTVAVEFLTAPYDGLLAHLDLSLLSKPVHDVTTPEVTWIEAHDGAMLYAEVTRPNDGGRWPVVLTSSPYNGGFHARGEPALWDYVTHDWAKRGYVVVNADVRGTGNSGGCAQYFGTDEQQDQVTLVEWAASQPWSDGNVAFYGQSYVATTAVEAAVQAPAALKAIIAVAPVTDTYVEWVPGGVPYGRSIAQPLAMQTQWDAAQPWREDPLQMLKTQVASVCDPTLAATAYHPHALYNDFYALRNFTARAADVQAAVLYMQGLDDWIVTTNTVTNWFNGIDAPKLGLFGPWGHQHPTRADAEAIFVGWLDEHVKGRPVGFEHLSAASVSTRTGIHRATDAWPPVDAGHLDLFPDLGAGMLSEEPVTGTASMFPETETYPFYCVDVLCLGGTPGVVPARLGLETDPFPDALHLAGVASLRTQITLHNTENAYLDAVLYEVSEASTHAISWGTFNVAHRDGHDRHVPVPPGELVTVNVPFRPTEWVISEGSRLRLELRVLGPTFWMPTAEPAMATLHGGDDGTRLVLPTLATGNGHEPLPVTATV